MRSILIPLYLMLLSGCALSPQVIEISPELVYENTSATHSKPISIQVNDIRTTTQLGSRGGVYSETAILTTGPEMTNNIYKELVDAFTSLGYRVSENQTLPNLIVSIANITYTNQKKTAANTILVRAAAKVMCKNQQNIMDNEYTITDRKDFINTPSDKDNIKLVNSTLSSAISRLFQDDKLLACLENQSIN
jgi:uncharacterized lipoprotein